jgi:integrase
MPVIKISDTSISKIKLPKPGQREFYWDDDLKGFGVKALSTGLTYIVQSRAGGSRESKLVRHEIGKVNTKSAKAARSEAAKALSHLHDGVNVNVAQKQKQKREEAEQTTLRDIFDDYVGKRELRPTTRKLYDTIIKLYLVELFQMPIMDISKNMIEKKLQTLASEPGTRGDRTAQAAQCFRLLRALIRFASEEYEVNGKPIVSLDLIKNVSKGKSWSKLEPRDTVIHPDDLSEWYEAVLSLESDKIRDFFLFLIFSGLRRSEAMRLRWEHFDTKTKTLTIPKELSKIKRTRKIPLPDVLLSIYRSRRAKIVVGNPYVFQGMHGKSHLTEPKRGVVEVKEAVTKQRQKANPKDESTIEWSSHDLRRTYATIASKLDVSYYKLKYLLGHSVGSDVTGKHYAQVTVDDVRDAAQEIADYLKEKMGMNTSLLEIAK